MFARFVNVFWLATPRTPPLWQRGFFLVNCLGVATLVGFGEKRCRKNLPLHDPSCMNRIALASADSNCDFDYGEGWIALCWLTDVGLDAELTIDLDGHCSREMPIRSGTGVSIVSVSRDSLTLNFTPQLAGKLELEANLEFVGEFSDAVYADIVRLAELF